jgi:hypothetical protein
MIIDSQSKVPNPPLLQYVELKMGFRVGEGSNWLRVKTWGLGMGFWVGEYSV